MAQALSKKPDDRFKTCADFVKALKGVGPVRPKAGAGGPNLVPAADTPTPSLSDTDSSSLTGSDGGMNSVLRRTLPALVTRKSKSTIMASATHLRRLAPDTGVLSRVGPPPPERFGEGLLVPALVVGIGGTGLAMLRRLRRLILERFGVPTLPHLRWLYVDTDPAAVEDAVTGSPAFHPEEVLLTRLHRPAHYLTREGLPAVDTWLSAEDLYRMPKTPATNGVRAIGRLALCDHHHALCSRLRSALEAFVKPDPLASADRQTGFGVRTNYPRVYVAASLAGGTGSGMFLDMAYLARRELRHIGFRDSQVTGLFAMPAHLPQLAATMAAGNTRAALSELAYYLRDGTVYETLFDTREKPVADSGAPFRRCAAVMHPPGKEASTTTMIRTGSVLAHTAFAELLTPMGRNIQPDGAHPDVHPFGFVGVGKLVWPRRRHPPGRRFAPGPDHPAALAHPDARRPDPRPRRHGRGRVARPPPRSDRPAAVPERRAEHQVRPPARSAGRGDPRADRRHRRHRRPGRRPGPPGPRRPASVPGPSGDRRGRPPEPGRPRC